MKSNFYCVLIACLLTTTSYCADTCRIKIILNVDDELIINAEDDLLIKFVAHQNTTDLSDDDTLLLILKQNDLLIDTLPGFGKLIFFYRNYEIEGLEYSLSKIRKIESLEVGFWTSKKNIKIKIKEHDVDSRDCPFIYVFGSIYENPLGHGDGRYTSYFECRMK